MRNLRIGLVTEGITDQIVLSNLLTAALRNNFSLGEISFINLQPSPDATSGNPNGGWELVYKWCLNNTPEYRSSHFFGKSLFAGDLDAQRCDALVVHLDSDICECIGSKSSLAPIPNESSTPLERGQFIENTLISWLWPAPSTPDDLHVIAPAVEQIEAWLLASLADFDDIETRATCQADLAIAYVKSIGKTPPIQMKKLQKSKRTYATISQEAAKNFLIIQQKCHHFHQLASRLSLVVRKLSAQPSQA